MTTPVLQCAESERLCGVTVGIAANRLRNLQRNWDYWFPKRAQYPFFPSGWLQKMAEAECLKLGPQISELRRKIEEYDRGKVA